MSKIRGGGVDMRLKISELADFSKFQEWKDAVPKEGASPSREVRDSSLRVYGDAYCLSLEVCRLCANLDKTYKYSLGEQLRLASFNLILAVQGSKAAEARRLLAEVQLCLRMLADLKAIPQKRFLSFVEVTDNISKQLLAWERSKPETQSAGVPVQ